jgi:hypothetical protein
MFIATCVLLALLPSGPGDWRWPLEPTPRVLRGYDPPPRPWLSGHRGIDLAARAGQPVYAAGAGRVGYAGRLAGRGVVTVLHGPLRTTYLPVRPSVRPGQRVTAGSRLGSMEDVRGHCGPRLCLHWGLRRGVAYLDPLSLLGLGSVRLLPVWESPGSAGPAARTHRLPAPAGASPEAVAAPAAAGARDDPVARPSGPVAAASGDEDRLIDRLTPPTLASATVTAGGGAVAGALLGYGLSLARHRLPLRRRLPPDVIDFTQERRRRRRRQTSA